MTSSVLNENIMVRKEVFWNIGEHSHFIYFPIISYQMINFYRVLIMDIGKVWVTRWFQLNMQMQTSQAVLCYLLCEMRYLGKVPIIIYVSTWSHTLNNVQ